MKSLLASLLGLLSITTAGCASTPAPAPAPLAADAKIVRSGCDVEHDRAAIRTMAGSFAVTFSFEEHDALTDGYVAKSPSHTKAREIVEVLEDKPGKVVLQHVLIVPGDDGKPEAMKHWRQDWVFEDKTVLEFEGRETFARRELPASAVGCTWSQAVFEVSDAPRYESVGRWVHAGDTSTWTSGITWRPLPRREYTKRHDYDVLIGQNKHVIRPDGWVHEQDNEKRVLATGKSLVKERGENKYVRAELAETKLATDYLRETGPFWAAVRDEWQATFAARPRFTLEGEVDQKLLYDVLFPLAKEWGASARPHGGLSEEQRRRVHATISRYIVAQKTAAR
jgi:hypothetical protein